MRRQLAFVLAAAMVPACAIISRSPALSSPLHEQLAKADSSRIEEVTRACLKEEGWTPDDVQGDAQGATVVSAKNAAKTRVSLYIQPTGSNPRVTGDPTYDDPYWKCLGRELGSAGPTAAPASSKDKDAP